MNEFKVNTVCDDALGDSDAFAIVERLEKGEVTPTELVEAAIKRANQANPVLNAIVTDTFDLALEQAKQPFLSLGSRRRRNRCSRALLPTPGI